MSDDQAKTLGRLADLLTAQCGELREADVDIVLRGLVWLEASTTGRTLLYEYLDAVPPPPPRETPLLTQGAPPLQGQVVAEFLRRLEGLEAMLRPLPGSLRARMAELASLDKRVRTLEGKPDLQQGEHPTESRG